MVSSLLSAVFLQSAEGFSLRTVWFLHRYAPSASADSVRLFGSLDPSYLMIGFKARLDQAKDLTRN